MQNINLEVDQEFYNFVSQYEFFKEGQLDYYAFCVYLAECLSRDNKLKVNNPNMLGQLFIDIVSESSDAPSWFQKIPNAGIPREAFHVYPNGELLLIHASAFIEYIHQFVWTIGDRLLDVDKANDDDYFAFWLYSSDIYSYAFLRKLFQEIRELTKEVDHSGVLKAGMQNVSLAAEKDLTNNLIVKDSITEIAISRIEKAIGDGYYLEAIALAESILSDRLALYLHHNGDKSDSKNLHKLVATSIEFNRLELFEEIDCWRQKRNKSIHGLVRLSPYENHMGIEEFDAMSADTANKGYKLVQQTESWFENYIYEVLNPYQIKPFDVYRNKQSSRQH